MNIIETEKLTKYYGKSRGIIDLNLTVEEGDFFGFIGPNGAGKSTTIRTLLGLIRATSGSARLFEKDSADCRQEILSQIGYVLQRNAGEGASSLFRRSEKAEL